MRPPGEAGKTGAIVVERGPQGSKNGFDISGQHAVLTRQWLHQNARIDQGQMKAFLSHSSKDKPFVTQVANGLGPAQCEFDQYTFDYTLTTQAIRRALSRSDLFVLFLSENSLRSPFVQEELRLASELRGQGRVAKILIFPLDDTSYSSLPDWLRSINVTIRLKSPLTIARKIQATLVQLDVEKENISNIYIPRDREEALLRQALSKPPGEAPIALHTVGYLGLGRRTLLKKVLNGLFPRYIHTFVPITMNKFEGINEFYRRVYEYFMSSSIEEQLKDFKSFADSSEGKQLDQLDDLFIDIISGEEFIIVDDQGGVYTDEGDYQPFFKSLLSRLKAASRPVIGFAQTRMMPLRYRELYSFSYHLPLNPLEDDKTSELASFKLRDAGIDFSAQQLADLCLLLDGNPVNVQLAVNVIQAYGLEAFLADPSLLIEWKRRRGEDFLSKITFSGVESDIMAVLIDYRYVNLELIMRVVSYEITEVTAALRKLEEYCCVERHGPLYAIPAAIHDAGGRDKRFHRNEKWRQTVAVGIVDSMADYQIDERAPIGLIEAAATASIVSGKSQTLVSRFILPSYYITLARRAYDDDAYGQTIKFCKLAWDSPTAITVEGKVEVLRLWGLAAVRLGDKKALQYVLDQLEQFKSKKIARRHSFFLRGFHFRFERNFDLAETEFLKAHDLAPNDFSINRELASLYRHQGEFVEAESYARAAYAVAPTNPYILDVLLECLLGKSYQGMEVDQSEIAGLFRDLERYGDVPGSSFYQQRIAQDLSRQRKYPSALAAANKAVDRTPGFLPCYFLRCEINLVMRNTKGARDDLNTINKLLSKRGGFSQDEERKREELAIKVEIEERQFKKARDSIEKSAFISRRANQRLLRLLAGAINLQPQLADAGSREWARTYSKR